MGIPIVSEIVDVGRTIFVSFIGVMPTPLKIIFFLLILVLFGSFITGFFLDNNYECEERDGQTVLVDVNDFDQCFQIFGNGWAAKNNITTELLNKAQTSNLSNAQLRALNETLEDIHLGVYYEESYLFGRTSSAEPAVIWRNFVRWFSNTSSANFVDVFVDPAQFECQRLYQCLPEAQGLALGLSASCILSDLPEWSEYIDVTKPTVTGGANIDPEGEGIDFFKVQCESFSEEPTPALTFLGFDFLNVKLWAVLIIMGIAISFAAKMEVFAMRK